MEFCLVHCCSGATAVLFARAVLHHLVRLQINDCILHFGFSFKPAQTYGTCSHVVTYIYISYRTVFLFWMTFVEMFMVLIYLLPMFKGWISSMIFIWPFDEPCPMMEQPARTYCLSGPLVCMTYLWIKLWSLSENQIEFHLKSLDPHRY